MIALKRLPLPVAKSVLTALSCRPGAVSKKSSKSVPKGSVISTSPGPGSHPAGTKVKLTVSSGMPKKHS